MHYIFYHERKVMKICIYYGSTTGVTENIARSIAKALNNEETIVKSISTAELAEIQGTDFLILGSSTWGYGDLQDDWTTGIEIIKQANLTGKIVALFGVGDQLDWSDTFVDAMGIIYETIVDSGAEIVGSWPTNGYKFSHSKAVVHDTFVGLAIDENNQPDETDSRISQWVASLC